MGDLRVRVLGGLDVEGLAPAAVGSRKARLVLKALAVERGRPVPTDRLVAAVWDDAPPGRPADQLGVLVSRLRGALGAERVRRVDSGYVLAYDWLDVVELDERIDEAAVRLAAGAPAGARVAADAAVALLRGPLLPGDEGAWVEGPRAAAGRVAGRAWLLAAEAALAGGDPVGAATAAAAAGDHDPYDEAALRLLMVAQVGAGRPGSALAAYAEVRTRLAEDLGVPPAPDTERLHAAILRDEPLPGPVGTAGPPAGVARAGPAGAPTVAPVGAPHGGAGSTVAAPGLVGREAELAWLDARWAEATAAPGTGRLAVVEGEAGIGKSALVAAWAAGRGDALVLWARAEPTGLNLALQPVADALAGHLHVLSADERAAVLGEDRAVVAPLLRRDGAAATATAAALASSGPTLVPGPDATPAYVFAGLWAVLQRAAAGRGIVVVVDDAHRADEATLAWLAYAVRRSQLLVVATRRPGPGRGGLVPDGLLSLGPLDPAAAAALVGPERAARLHRRSGGNPLFLRALAEADDRDGATPNPAAAARRTGTPPDAAGHVPATIADTVAQQLDLLGPAGPTLVAAAVLGPAVDLDLLAGVTGRPAAALLDDIEAAAAVRILVETGRGFGFAHELVQEAVAATASASRRALAHREAARVTAGRGDGVPLAVARHARFGGDPAMAAAALVTAAGRSGPRGDHAGAVRLLDEAVALADGAGTRLARARARLAVRDLAGAAVDAAAAIDAGAGVAGFELAGWAAYYLRDLDAAARFAEEGAVRAGDDALRASCLCLAGRVRQTRGDLGAADERLATAFDIAPAELRPLAAIWLGELRSYQGRAVEAEDLTGRGLLDRAHLGHPFALPHALMTRCYTAGMAGRGGDLLAATDRFRSEMVRLGEPGARYRPAADNFRAWALRSLGRGEEAAELNESAREASAAATGLEEPWNQATLDLVEGHLLAGDTDAAGHALDKLRALDRDDAVMVWHQRERAGLAQARLAWACGDPAGAATAAAAVAEAAEGRGSARHARTARVVEALARVDAGEPFDDDRVERLLAALDGVAGLEAWRWSAEAAHRGGTDRARHAAEARAAALLASLGPADRPSLERRVTRSLT